MLYGVLAHAVMLIHFGFLVFVTLGGFLAWRYLWVAVVHLTAVGWGLYTAVVGAPCPLTAWEDELRRLRGEHGLPGGFIDTYLTGVVYPQDQLLTAQLLVAALVVLSWCGLAVRLRRARAGETAARR
jgi:hypothetical protein